MEGWKQIAIHLVNVQVERLKAERDIRNAITDLVRELRILNGHYQTAMRVLQDDATVGVPPMQSGTR